jgi:hypothetical protein
MPKLVESTDITKFVVKEPRFTEMINASFNEIMEIEELMILEAIEV